MTNKEILKVLTELSDATYAEKLKLQSSTDSLRKIIGVPTKELTEVARELVCRNDWRSIVKKLPDDYYETTLLQAFIYLRGENNNTKRIEWLRSFVEKIDSIALCDNTCLAYITARTCPEETLLFVKECLNSTREMTIRFAIVMLLDYFTTSDYADTTLELYNRIDTSHSPICRKALAWGYSVCFMSFPKRTIEALKCRIPKDETNQIIQDILTLPRITNAAHETISSLLA